MNPLRRKLVLATWTPPKEGNIYGKLTLDTTQASSYLKYLRNKTGQKYPDPFYWPSHRKAISKTQPSMATSAGVIIPHQSVDVSFRLHLRAAAISPTPNLDAHTKTPFASRQ